MAKPTFDNFTLLDPVLLAKRYDTAQSTTIADQWCGDFGLTVQRINASYSGAVNQWGILDPALAEAQIYAAVR